MLCGGNTIGATTMAKASTKRTSLLNTTSDLHSKTPDDFLSITVQGDLGTWTAGMLLTDPQSIINYHRDVVNEGADEPTKLTDAQILVIVKAVQGDSVDAEVE